MELWKHLMNLLYPQTCHFCGKLDKRKICDKCAKDIEYINEPRCKKCGKPVRYKEQELCGDCQGRTFAFEQGKSIWLHKGNVRWSLYQFKYHNRRIYGEFYAEELNRLYGRKLKEWEIDVIIPIPLHKKRLRKREYNQTEIIAKHLGKITGIPVECKALMRIRNTSAQKELGSRERRKNLEGAFSVTKAWKRIPHVLLLDDIYTTGSTIDAAAQTLRKHGAEKIWFLTISIGQGF